jgi:hypothetical protein
MKQPELSLVNILTPENTDVDTDSATTVGASSETESFAGVTDTESEADSDLILRIPRGRAEQTPTPAQATRRDRSVDSDWSLADASSSHLANGSDWTPINRELSTMPSLARTMSSESEAFGGSDMSDNDSAASLLDSLIIGDAYPTRGTAPSDSNPFTSQYNIPLAARNTIPPSILVDEKALTGKDDRKRKVTFFEYLYG